MKVRNPKREGQPSRLALRLNERGAGRIGTVAQKYNLIFFFLFSVHLIWPRISFPIYHLPSFVPRVSLFAFSIFRFPFAVRRHLCHAFLVLYFAFMLAVFHFPFGTAH